MPKKQKSGLYRTKIKIGVDAEGRDIVKWISAKTRRELEEEKQRVRQYYINGADRPADRLFGEYAIEWYRLRKSPFISPSHQNSYRSMLNRHVLPEFGDRNLRAIRAADLQRFINSFAGASATQIAMALIVLRGVFGAACSDRILDSDPALQLRKPAHTPPREKRALSPVERANIEQTIAAHPHGEYLAVLYYTGMRPGEARGLQWGDIDWEANMIHVQRDLDFATGKYGSLKTRAADRFVPLIPALREYLYSRRSIADAPVVSSGNGKPITSTAAAQLWTTLMLASSMAEKIPEGETHYSKQDIRAQYRAIITPHCLRHNFITMCWDMGMDVQLVAKIVGHSDVKVTMAIYTHLDKTHVAAAADQLSAMFSRENAQKKKVAQKLHSSPGDLVQMKTKKA